MTVLRPYQADLDARMTAAFDAGARGVCAVMATGAGKTVVIAHRVRRYVAQGLRVGVVCHRTELIEQTIAKLRGAGVGSIGAVAAKLPHLAAAWAMVQVASLQTLLARGTPLDVNVMIFDEGHHLGDETRWGEFAGTYGHLPRELYTATPQRGDGRGLTGVADALVEGPTLAELTAMGHLVSCEVFAPLVYLGAKVAQDPVEFWLRHGCAGKRTLWFARTKAHGVELEQKFEAAGARALFVHEGTPQTTMRRAFADFTADRLTVLVNVFRLTEGTDLPPVEVVGLSTCAEDITYLQTLGRGLRPSPATGKTKLIVLDLSGATRKHRHPLVPRAYSLDGRGMSAAEGVDWQCPECGYIAQPGERAPGGPCPHCGWAAPEEDTAREVRPSVTGHDVFLITPAGDTVALTEYWATQLACTEQFLRAQGDPDPAREAARIIADRLDTNAGRGPFHEAAKARQAEARAAREAERAAKREARETDAARRAADRAEAKRSLGIRNRVGAVDLQNHEALAARLALYKQRAGL